MSVTSDEFRSVMRSWASGVTVITTRGGAEHHDAEHHGMTVSSFTSVSLIPPLVSACLDADAKTLGWLRTSGRFAVNILSADQAEISSRFANPDEDQRFEGLAFSVGGHGCALLDGVCAHFECDVFAMYEVGDHVMVIGKVVACRSFDHLPLLYSSGTYGSVTPQ